MKKTIGRAAMSVLLAATLAACGDDGGTDASQYCRDTLQVTCESLDRCGYLGLAGYTDVGDCYDRQAAKCSNVVWRCDNERENWYVCVEAIENMECSGFLTGTPPAECNLCD